MIPHSFRVGGNARAHALLQVVRRSACDRQIRRVQLVVLASVANRRGRWRRLALRYFDQLTKGCPVAEVPSTACAVLSKFVSQPRTRPFSPISSSWRIRDRVVYRAALRAEMVECIQAAARDKGLTLSGDLASAALANAHTCPIHGVGPCDDGGFVSTRGCLLRQLAALSIQTDCSANEVASCQLDHVLHTCLEGK